MAEAAVVCTDMKQQRATNLASDCHSASEPLARSALARYCAPVCLAK